ncbi:hypothetical protein ATCC90586_001032 [Pythium insidiosum]|nr:hypothetical protein ATCC90586_001032 [Pythium insidiosum]
MALRRFCLRHFTCSCAHVSQGRRLYTLWTSSLGFFDVLEAALALPTISFVKNVVELRSPMPLPGEPSHSSPSPKQMPIPCFVSLVTSSAVVSSAVGLLAGHPPSVRGVSRFPRPGAVGCTSAVCTWMFLAYDKPELAAAFVGVLVLATSNFSARGLRSPASVGVLGGQATLLAHYAVLRQDAEWMARYCNDNTAHATA